MTTERIETRDAQARVIALPTGDLIIGSSSVRKPRTDSAGMALKETAQFYEYDTFRTFLWFDNDCRLKEATLSDVVNEVHSAVAELIETNRHLRGIKFGIQAGSLKHENIDLEEIP